MGSRNIQKIPNAQGLEEGKWVTWIWKWDSNAQGLEEGIWATRIMIPMCTYRNVRRYCVEITPHSYGYSMLGVLSSAPPQLREMIQKCFQR